MSEEGAVEVMFVPLRRQLRSGMMEYKIVVYRARPEPSEEFRITEAVGRSIEAAIENLHKTFVPAARLWYKAVKDEITWPEYNLLV